MQDDFNELQREPELVESKKMSSDERANHRSMAMMNDEVDTQPQERHSMHTGLEKGRGRESMSVEHDVTDADRR